MTRRTRPRRAGTRLTLLGLAGLVVGGVVLVVVAVLALAGSGDHVTAPDVSATAPGDLTFATGDTDPLRARGHRRRGHARVRRPRRASRPVAIEIRAIGVRARVIPLGLNPDRTLEVPSDFRETGWWTGGARPGEHGPAVIAGHVDSTSGPGVFYELSDLDPGDAIVVARRDGSRVRFTVQRSERYAKASFPTARVYGRTPGPTLRLITCSGDFDRSTGHYLDNTVVFAALA